MLIEVHVNTRRDMLEDIDVLQTAASTAEKQLDFMIQEVKCFTGILFNPRIRNQT